VPRAATTNSATPGRADQEAEAERKTNGCQRSLRDDLLEGLLERGGGILRFVHHGATTLGSLVERRIDVGAGLLVTAPRLRLGCARERIEGFGDLVGQSCDIGFHGGHIFLEPRNFSNLMRQTSVTGVLAVGMLMVIVTAQIDLSIGSLVGLAGGIAATVLFRWLIPARPDKRTS